MVQNHFSTLMDIIDNLPFAKENDFSVILPYLSFLEGNCFLFSSCQRTSLSSYFKEVVRTLNSKLNKIHNFIEEKSNDQIKNFRINRFQHSENKLLNEENRILYVLSEKKRKNEKLLMTNLQKIVSTQINLIQKLLILCNYFIDHPQPIWIDLQNAFPNIEIAAFYQNPDLYIKTSIINSKIQEKLDYVETIPMKLFSFIENNKKLLNKAIDIAISYKKAEINYFEELPIEETLYSFFESDKSPFYNSKIFPINIDYDNNSVIDWLNKAKYLLIQYDPQIDTEEKESVIDIFLTRFLFDHLYSSIGLSDNNSFEINKKLKWLSQCTPKKNECCSKIYSKRINQ